MHIHKQQTNKEKKIEDESHILKRTRITRGI